MSNSNIFSIASFLRRLPILHIIILLLLQSNSFVTGTLQPRNTNTVSAANTFLPNSTRRRLLAVAFQPSFRSQVGRQSITKLPRVLYPAQTVVGLGKCCNQQYYPSSGRSFASWSTNFCSSPSSTSLYLARGRGAKANKNKKQYSSSQPVNMPRGVKKENLPSKVCVTCGRPFTWRKKWEKVWDEVTTCSKSCNHKRRLAKRDSKSEPEGSADLNKSSNERPTRGHQQQQQQQQEHLPKQELNAHNTNEIETVISMTDELTMAALHDDIHNADESFHSEGSVAEADLVALRKAERKAAKKAKKAERRAQREGRGDPTAGQKKCDMCEKSVDLLIRCVYEEGQTNWSMVCGKCWKVASGGVVDGDSAHPHYRYGGLWKNRRAQTS